MFLPSGMTAMATAAVDAATTVTMGTATDTVTIGTTTECRPAAGHGWPQSTDEG